MPHLAHQPGTPKGSSWISRARRRSATFKNCCDGDADGGRARLRRGGGGRVAAARRQRCAPPLSQLSEGASEAAAVRRGRRYAGGLAARRQPIGEDDCALCAGGAAAAERRGETDLDRLAVERDEPPEHRPAALRGRPGIVPFIPETEIAQVRTSPDWEVIGHEGWRCVLKSCEQGRDKFAGAAIDEVDYDEPPTWPIYNECAIRFGAGSRVLVRMAATLLPPPGQSGGVCQWLWSEKIEPWLHKRLGDDTRIINVSMADNPYITEEQLG